MAWSSVTSPLGGAQVSTSAFGIPVAGNMAVLGNAWTTDARSAATIWTAATTNPVIGNGTLVSRYVQAGKTIDWGVTITMGSTSTFGTGAWQLVLPFAALNQDSGLWVVRVIDSSVSTTPYTASADLDGSTTIITLRTLPAAAGNSDRNITNSAPMTWATGDKLKMAGRYEAA